MDGWMDGGREGGRDGCMDGWMDGWMDGLDRDTQGRLLLEGGFRIMRGGWL